MSLIDDATAAMLQLHSLTKGMKEGMTPDALSVLGIQSDLVDFYRQVGMEMSEKFGAKERAQIQRRTQQGKFYFQDRFNKEVRKAAKDAEMSSLLAVGEELGREAETAQEYDLYQTMLGSIDRAIRHSAQVVSFIGKAESHPS